MKQYSEMQTGSKLRRRRNFNSVTASGIAPDELGISITKSVFGWKTAASGVKAANGGDMGTNTAAQQWIDTYGMPFIFVIGGNQILLPPVVQTGGTAVPYLPDGLQIVWAPSFMNVAIPSDMLNILCVGGKLSIQPLEIGSAQSLFPVMSSRAVGSWTNNALIGGGDTSLPNQGETLLRLIMAALECLIYSYSSYPWGNGYNDLAGAVMTKRNWPNFLQYPDPKKTVLGNVLNAVTPIYTKYVAPVLGVAAGAVTGGVGAAAVGASVAALNSANNAENKANAPGGQMINTGLTTQELPSGTLAQDQGGAVVTAGSGPSSLLSNPIILIAIVLLIIFLIM
jgi:hypothetical protein